MLKKYFLNTSGVTGIEYGLILGSVAVAVSTGIFMIGDDFTSIFDGLSAYMNTDTPIKK